MMSAYTNKELQAMATNALRQYRKIHKDKIRRFVFNDVPWFVSVSDQGVTLNVQITNRETNWTENWNIAL